MTRPCDRRTLLLAAGGGALSLAAAPPLAARAAPARSDTEILEELLAVERRLESAYEAALDRRAIPREPGATLLAQEREHARGLEQVLASRGRRSPRATVPEPGTGPALEGPQAFARFALDLEARARAAYTDAAASVAAPALRQPLGSIMACEAAHEVALRSLLGVPLLTR